MICISSPCFGDPGRLCFVLVAFPEYLHLLISLCTQNQVCVFFVLSVHVLNLHVRKIDEKDPAGLCIEVVTIPFREAMTSSTLTLSLTQAIIIGVCKQHRSR